MPLRSISDPAGQSGTEEKRKIKWYHYIYLIQRLQCETAIPSACGRRTPIHSRNPVFVPAVCCPPFLFLVPCWNRGSIQASLSLILLCQLTPVFMPWMMKINKKEERRKYKTKRGHKHTGFIFLPCLSLLLALSHTETGAWGETSEWQRCMCFAPWLFTSSFSCSRFSSLPLFVSLCPSLLLSAACWFTQKLAALSRRVRSLYACRDICECAYVGGLK